MRKPAIYKPQSITVNLTPESDKKLRELSKKSGKSMNAIVNEAVRIYLEGSRKWTEPKTGASKPKR